MSQHGTQLPDGGEAEQPGSEDAKQWLLFAGPELEATADVPVAIFRDETQARRAFLNERLRSADPGAWAQLVAVDGTGETRAACWFGPRPILGEDRTVEENSSRSRPLAEGPTGRGCRRRVVAVAIVAALAAGTWLIAHDDTGSGRRTTAAGPFPFKEASAGVLVGYEATHVTRESYAPGEFRQWHPTDGLHQVTVLVGTLSVEDGAGHTTDYQPGASYVAGWAPYTASNGTARPVTVTVRFLRPASGQDAEASVLSADG